MKLPIILATKDKLACKLGQTLRQHGLKDNLTIDVLRANNPNLFFYINIYFSNRLLIQLIMENIPNFKSEIFGWCEES